MDKNQSLIRYLIEGKIDLPSIPWNDFYHRSYDLGLETLFYYRVQKETPFPLLEEQKVRLRQTFEQAFAHYARVCGELREIETLCKEERLSFYYLKGFSLAKYIYPHPATRLFQDIDLLVRDEYLPKFDEILRTRGYSALPIQAPMSEKRDWVKLWGHYVFGLERHDELHSHYGVYRKKWPFKETKGFHLAKEDIFLSVLLHHKFFESSYRDFIDLELIYRKSKHLDWSYILEACGHYRLKRHLGMVLELARHYDCQWPKAMSDSLSGLSKGSSLKVWLRQNVSLPMKQKRGFLNRFGDLIWTLFLFDHFSYSWACFMRKYLIYFLPGRVAFLKRLHSFKSK